MKRKRNGRLNSEEKLFQYHCYNLHYACFVCRKMFNKASYLRRFDKSKNGFDCPDCGEAMSNMSKDFKPPRRHNIKQWRKCELLFNRGYRWEHSAYYRRVPPTGWSIGYFVQETVSDGPTARTLREAKEDYPPRAQP